MLNGGRYEVSISYGRSALGGGTVEFSVGDQSVECTPPATPTADVFERIHLGELTLKPGPAVLKAEVIQAHGPEVMRLNKIFLKRISKAKR